MDNIKALEELIRASELMKNVTPRDRMNVDEVELVFVDNLNGKLKPRRTFTFLDMMEAIEEGSKPIGIILLNYSDSDLVSSRQLPDIGPEAQEALMHALAEAQDQVNRHSNENPEED